MLKTPVLLVLSATLGLTTLGARADPPRKHPPKEAVEACVGKQSGAACSFESPRGTVHGTCFKPNDAPPDAPFACKPADR
jgi:hypothetical protein